MSGFTHLHVHTEYSLLDGACRIEKLVERAKELGQDAVAITDHGVLYGAINFYNAAKKAGIKPIIGCEVYVAPRGRQDKEHSIDSSPYHLVLLCENEEGYENLIKLVSVGFTEGFYSKPRVDREMLKKYSKGLIALSACLAGEIPRRLGEGNYEAAVKVAEFYRDTFGKDNYFIEVQNHGIDAQKEIIPDLIRLSKEVGVGLVATNDCHYIRKEDALMQKVLLCIQTGKTLEEENAMEFPTNEFYLKSEDEMRKIFGFIPESIENTHRISQRCNVDFVFGKTKLPNFTVPTGEDNLEYFNRLTMEGFRRIYGDNPPESYVSRLRYEMEVITKMGYVNYYLIVADFINYAKTHGIPVGPGRGSGAASIVAYCMGITGLDPMKYQLIFERFLNTERVSMPDFDVDFCIERRQEVIEYVKRKYGEDHVSQIVTFGTLAAKAAVRDVGRVLGMSYGEVDAVAKLIPFSLDMTLEKALEIRELRDLYDTNSGVKRLIDTAMAIEGMPRNISMHAAGVVITDRPVTDYVPLSKSDDAVVTQFTMKELEKLGLLKMDFLGLRNLTVIASAEREIKKKIPQFDINKIPENDKGVMDMLSSGQTEGVFQFESGGMRQVLTKVKPTSMEDLIAIISLYRPGPMDSIPQYIENRHHPEKITYSTPLLAPILDSTYGCIVYQEQVMEICRSLAGFSYGRSDLVRYAMAKKNPKVMEEERHNFIYGKINEDGTTECEGAIKRGISEKTAREIYERMETFGKYAFNKAHAAAYAYVAYQTAYLKRHHSREYFAALLTSVADNAGKVNEYIGECKRMAISVLPVDIRYSHNDFRVEGDTIRFGFLAVRNLGKNVISEIVEERTERPFADFFDFCERMIPKGLNKRSLESLVKCGAFDSMNSNRNQLFSSIDAIVAFIGEDRRKNVEGQTSLFGSTDSPREFTYYNVPDFSPEDKLNYEKEVTGFYLSGHPLDSYRETIEKANPFYLSELENSIADGMSYKLDGKTVKLMGIITSVKTKVLKNGSKMAVLIFEDLTGECECAVFSKVLEKYGAFVKENTVVTLDGKISIKDDMPPSIAVNAISPKIEIKPEYGHNVSPVVTKDMAKKGRIVVKGDVSGIQHVMSCLDGGDFEVLYVADKTVKLDGSTGLSMDVLKKISDFPGVTDVAIQMYGR